MAATREDLRDHLTAVINAGQELPAEDRPYLADTFLNDLESRFQLVPRSHGAPPAESTSSRPWFAGFAGRGPVSIGVMVLLAVLCLPLLMMSLFVLIHPPVFLLALLVLVFFRFARPGMRRRRAPYGSRRGDMSHYNH